MQAFTAIFLAVVLAAVGIVDVWLGTVYGMEYTITAVIRVASQQWPIIPFAVGCLVGHLFW